MVMCEVTAGYSDLMLRGGVVCGLRLAVSCFASVVLSFVCCLLFFCCCVYLLVVGCC